MKVITHPGKPKAIPKEETEVGRCYSNEFPAVRLFIRIAGYSMEEPGFVNLASGMFFSMGESCSNWYEVAAVVVVE